MNCEQAKELIDLRVHVSSAATAASATAADAVAVGATGGLPASASGRSGEWTALDAHLATCAKCRAELEELKRVNSLLADLATDRPNDAEVQKMWMGIQTVAVVPSRLAFAGGRGWWSVNKGLVSSLTGVAAVLALAFYVGEMRYGGREAARRAVSSIFTNVDTSLPTGSAAELADTRNLMSLGYLSPSSDANETRERARVAAQERLAGRSAFQGLSADASAAMAKNTAATPPPPAPELVNASPGDLLAKGGEQETYGIDGVRPTDARADMDENAVYLSFRDETASAAATQESKDNEQSPRLSAVPQNLKIIKTGELTLEVSAHATATEEVEAIVRQHGGFIADATTQEESGGALLGRIVIRVQPERFEQVFAALKPLGRVLSENVKAADVTAEYVDTDARIKSLQITEERLRELIANKSIVDKISALLEVERELNRVRTDIEKLQGQLRVMDDRISLSTIILTLREPGRTVPSASLSVEVTTLDEAAANLSEMLTRAGGRLISGHTSKRGDGTLMGNYQLEITLARFPDLVTAIEKLGRVQERQVSNQQLKTTGESWAERVKCTIALVLFERSRQLPSGSIALEVDGVEKAIEQVREIADAHEATIVSNQTHGSAESATGATLQLRVPAGQFAKLLEALSTVGRSTNRSSFGEAGAIVGGAAAMPCDLTVSLMEKPREVPRGSMAIEVATFDPARQALSQAIRDQNVQVLHSSSNQRPDGTWQGTFRLGVPAKAMEAFVSTLESMGRVTGRQISGLGLGDLSRVNPDALGTIELTLAEKTSIAPGPDQATGSIRARIRDGLTGFYQSIGMIAYGLVVLMPWLLLAGLVGWLVVIIRRRTANRASEHQAAQPT